MSTETYVLQAGVPLQIGEDGDFLRLLESSAEVSFIYYRRGKPVRQAPAMLAGYAERFRPTIDDPEGNFDRVQLVSAVAQSVRIAIRKGADVFYDRMAGTVDVSTIAQGRSVNTIADVALPGAATVQIAPANPQRRRLDFRVSTTCRWGDANTGAARGVEVPGGIIVSAETAGAVYVYSANPGTVSITEITE